MNAPISPALPLLTTSEVQAHLAIVTVLEDVYFCRIDDKTALHRMWPHFAYFAPRCNCRRKLMFGPWRSGSRIVACVCGVSYFEALT